MVMIFLMMKHVLMMWVIYFKNEDTENVLDVTPNVDSLIETSKLPARISRKRKRDLTNWKKV
jgi:hypothetical protein